MMNRRDGVVLALLAVGAGFVGGAVANESLWGRAAHAQGAAPSGGASGTVAAQAFVLVDAAGKERASLRVEADNATRLTICDPSGRRRATLGVTKNGACALLLYDPSDESRLAVMDGSDGAPFITLYDAAGEMRSYVGVRKDGAPGIRLYGVDNKQVWSAP